MEIMSMILLPLLLFSGCTTGRLEEALTQMNVTKASVIHDFKLSVQQGQVVSPISVSDLLDRDYIMISTEMVKLAKSFSESEEANLFYASARREQLSEFNTSLDDSEDTE